MNEIEFFVALLVWLFAFAAWSEWMNYEPKNKKNAGETTAEGSKEDRESYQNQAIKISQEVAVETEEYAKHHITGQMLTAMAVVLRKIYGWSVEDTLEMLDQVNGVTNALNAGEIDDADLITEGEQYGIKISWRMLDDRRLYIGGLDVYEHSASAGDIESGGD